MPTTDDERALLAAVVADPADDTVRLAYADCIEERGNAPRAAFIRTQIEAEHHHIDSPRRAALHERACELLDTHWIEWWSEVCHATGLVVPAPRPTTLLGRLLSGGGFFRAGPGAPYVATTFDSDLFIDWFAPLSVVNQGFVRATLRRGFPEELVLTHHRSGVGSLLKQWTAAAPLTALRGVRPFDEHWYDGPHLRGVRSLVLREPDAACVRAVFQSPHLLRLSELEVQSSDFRRIREVLELARPKQLTHLTCVVQTLNDLHSFAACDRLAELTSLSVTAPSSPGFFADLARSPHLTKLRELRLDLGGQLDPAEYRALSSPGFKGLQSLVLHLYADDFLLGQDPEPGAEHLDALVGCAALPHLQELRVNGLPLDRAGIDVLVRSPLIKQLKHLAFAAHIADDVTDADLRRLPEMFDLDRIETFAFGTDRTRPGLDALAKVLGERLRLPNAR